MKGLDCAAAKDYFVLMRQQSTISPQGAFADLGTGETAVLAAGIRSLPWIDGLLTATMVSPKFVEPELWIDQVCDDATWEKLSPLQGETFISVLTDRQIKIAEQLAEQPETYQPFLGSGTDRMAAAAQWAAGFRAGIRLQPEPWRPVIDDDDTCAFLSAIFCLEPDENLSPEGGAGSPFADVPPERREQMRAIGVDMLPAAVLALHVATAELAGIDDLVADEDDLFANLPYVREEPKTGRNDPCPCGSGKKYKKCCLKAAASG